MHWYTLMTDQSSSISIGKKVGGIGLSMNTNILKYRLDSQLLESGTRRPISKTKWGVFSMVLPVRTIFYFMNRNYFISFILGF